MEGVGKHPPQCYNETKKPSAYRVNVSVNSKPDHPPGYPREFAHSSCPWGRVFAPLSCPGVLNQSRSSIMKKLRFLLCLLNKWVAALFICLYIYTYLQNKRSGGAGCPPPPIIFERLQLPQQIIYGRKENLSESPNHQKYWENILVSRFYEQFSRNRWNLGHFRKFEKISNS